jgi:transposase
MSNHSIIFIGLDTHKVSTEVAYCFDQRDKKPVHHSKIETTKQALEKLVRQFQSKHPKATLHFVYKKILIPYILRG